MNNLVQNNPSMVNPNKSLLVSSHILSGTKFKEDNPDLDFLVNPKQSDYEEEKKQVVLINNIGTEATEADT
jgi:P pilus assembly chaperone PapD